MNNDKVISVMKRYELKYHLNSQQVDYFKKEILNHMKVDKYGLTTIGSIYYDTPNNRMINRSIEKPYFKEKLRLRSYGSENNDSPLFLEIKRKSEKIVYKRRIMTDINKVNRFFLLDEKFGDSQIDRELKAFKDQYGTLEAKYLIIYDRIAYYQENSDVRITLDMNPRYRTNDLEFKDLNNAIPLLNKDEAILEIKVQHSIPLWLVEILTKGKIYQTSFSKVGSAHMREMNKKVLINIPLNEEVQGGYQYGLTI